MAPELFPQLVGDAAAILLGRMLGRTFKLDQQKASRLGIWIVWGAIGIAGAAITFLYS